MGYAIGFAMPMSQVYLRNTTITCNLMKSYKEMLDEAVADITVRPWDSLKCNRACYETVFASVPVPKD